MDGNENKGTRKRRKKKKRKKKKQGEEGKGIVFGSIVEGEIRMKERNSNRKKASKQTKARIRKER